MTTTTIDVELDKRRPGRPRKARITMYESLLTALTAEMTKRSRITFPSATFAADPQEFARRILGVELWAKQRDIVDAVRDNKRVAVSSGHKVSKSHSAAVIALWYYCSFPDARVIMTSTTSRQVDQILWRELRILRARSGRCVECKLADPTGLRIPRPCQHSAMIEGEQGELARTGLKSPDFREVVGFTAREAEAVAGISGKNLLYILDEASGINEDIFEAIEGNRAGGARIVMFSNPTQNAGEFYEAFHTKKSFYKTITISSAESPNVVEGRDVIPGLATREWIEEKKEEWGEHSALFRVRVLGEFATNEDGKIFSVHAIERSERMWHETAPAGRLFIGLDPAGPSGSGDETVFAIRRGQKLLSITGLRGLDADAHLVHLLATITRNKLPRETPVVVLDREGKIGAELYGTLRNHVEVNKGSFELVGVRCSERALRAGKIYDRVRDELAANLEAWIRDGGTIPEDVKLATEMHTLEWKQHVNGRLKVTPKDAIKKIIGRSPDRYDALALSVWEPLSLSDGVTVAQVPGAAASRALHAEQVLDPYGARDAWK